MLSNAKYLSGKQSLKLRQSTSLISSNTHASSIPFCNQIKHDTTLLIDEHLCHIYRYKISMIFISRNRNISQSIALRTSQAPERASDQRLCQVFFGDPAGACTPENIRKKRGTPSSALLWLPKLQDPRAGKLYRNAGGSTNRYRYE